MRAFINFLKQPVAVYDLLALLFLYLVVKLDNPYFFIGILLFIILDYRYEKLANT